jgi:hypothetical protein
MNGYVPTRIKADKFAEFKFIKSVETHVYMYGKTIKLVLEFLSTSSGVRRPVAVR